MFKYYIIYINIFVQKLINIINISNIINYYS